MKLTQWQNIFQGDYKCKFNSTTCSLNQEWNNKTFQCEYKTWYMQERL